MSSMFSNKRACMFADCTVQRRRGAGVWVWYGNGSSPAVSDTPGSAIWDTHQPSRRPLRPVPSLWAGKRGCLTWKVLNSLGLPPYLYRYICTLSIVIYCNIHITFQFLLLTRHFSLTLWFSVSFFLLSMASSTFKDFDLASTQQRPDSVLRRRRRQKQAALESSAASSVVAQPSAARRFVRLAVMGLTVALGAAALAVVNTALEWAPKLDLFPWTAPVFHPLCYNLDCI